MPTNTDGVQEQPVSTGGAGMNDYKHAFKVARMAEDALIEVRGLVGALPNLASRRESDDALEEARHHVSAALAAVHSFCEAQVRPQ